MEKRSVSYGLCVPITESRSRLAEIVTEEHAVKPTSGNIPQYFQTPRAGVCDLFLWGLPGGWPGRTQQGAPGMCWAFSPVSGSMSAWEPSHLLSKPWAKSLTSYSHFSDKLSKTRRALQPPEDCSPVRYCLLSKKS